MFTGIVLEIGKVVGWKQGPQICQLTIECKQVLEDARVGDSIAVNGVCLTAANIYGNSFTADIMVESLNKTALKQLDVGSAVNLEPALQVGGRLGGHWVTAHIDDIGRITSIVREHNSIWYSIQVPEHLMAYLVPKGSIALDGTSLTIARLDGNSVVVSLIPHTASATILGEKIPGDLVNVETDILGKYVASMLNRDKKQTGVTMEKLQQFGFM